MGTMNQIILKGFMVQHSKEEMVSVYHFNIIHFKRKKENFIHCI